MTVLTERSALATDPAPHKKPRMSAGRLAAYVRVAVAASPISTKSATRGRWARSLEAIPVVVGKTGPEPKPLRG